MDEMRQLQKTWISQRAYKASEDIHDLALSHAFLYLSGSDLKRCRLVCRLWNQVAETIMPEKLRIICSPRKYHSTWKRWRKEYFSKKCLRFVRKHSFVSSELMEISNLWISSITRRKQRFIFQQSVQSVLSLLIGECDFTRESFLLPLYQFKNLQQVIYVNNKCMFGRHVGPWAFPLSHHSFNEAKEYIKNKFGKTKYHLPKLTSIILWNRSLDDDPILFLQAMHLSVYNLVTLDIVINFEDTSKWGTEWLSHRTNELTTAIGQLFLHTAPTLKRFGLCLSTTLLNPVHTTAIILTYHCFVNIILMINTLSNISLTDFYIFLNRIVFERESFQEIVRPFLRRLLTNGLQQLVLLELFCPPWSNPLVIPWFQELNVFNSQCCFEIRVNQTYGYPMGEDDTSTQTREERGHRITNSNLPDLIENLFSSMSLRKQIRWSIRVPDDESYNFSLDRAFTFITRKLVCSSLSELIICDGHKSNYRKTEPIGGQTWSRTMGLMTDCRFQEIISFLPCLKTLILWLNMSLLTDFAITGRCYSHDDYERILKRKKIPRGNEKDNFLPLLVGKSISALSGLQTLALCGTGCLVTDESVRFGFLEINHLERLEILGRHSITKSGKAALRKKYSFATSFRIN